MPRQHGCIGCRTCHLELQNQHFGASPGRGRSSLEVKYKLRILMTQFSPNVENWPFRASKTRFLSQSWKRPCSTGVYTKMTQFSIPSSSKSYTAWLSGATSPHGTALGCGHLYCTTVLWLGTRNSPQRAAWSAKQASFTCTLTSKRASSADT